MDELDLVRAARPDVAAIDDAPLAALKARALGDVETSASASVSVAADDGQAIVLAPLIELPSGPASPHRRRRLVLSIAAAVALLAAGAIVVSAHRRASGPVVAAGQTDQSLASALVGEWQVDGYPATVAFKSGGGGVALATPCGLSVSSGYRVDRSALVLVDPLSSPELACNSDQAVGRHEQLVRLLDGRPIVRVDGDALTLTSGTTSVTLHRAGATGVGVEGTSTTAALPATSPATSSPPTTAARVGPEQAPPDETTYDITRLVVDGNERPLVAGSLPSISLSSTQLRVATGCNGVSGTARIVDDRLTLDEYTNTLAACDDEHARQEDALVAIITAQPTVRVEGDSLTLTAGTSAVEAHLRLDRALVGTTWNRGGHILPDGHGVIGFAGGQGALMLSGDGTWTYIGCIEEAGRYVIDGTTLTLARDGTNTATPGTDSTCTTEQTNDERAAAADLFDHAVTWSINGYDLTLVAPSGGGAQFRAG